MSAPLDEMAAKFLAEHEEEFERFKSSISLFLERLSKEEGHALAVQQFIQNNQGVWQDSAKRLATTVGVQEIEERKTFLKEYYHDDFMCFCIDQYSASDKTINSDKMINAEHLVEGFHGDYVDLASNEMIQSFIAATPDFEDEFRAFSEEHSDDEASSATQMSPVKLSSGEALYAPPPSTLATPATPVQRAESQSSQLPRGRSDSTSSVGSSNAPAEIERARAILSYFEVTPGKAVIYMNANQRARTYLDSKKQGDHALSYYIGVQSVISVANTLPLRKAIGALKKLIKDTQGKDEKSEGFPREPKTYATGVRQEVVGVLKNSNKLTPRRIGIVNEGLRDSKKASLAQYFVELAGYYLSTKQQDKKSTFYSDGRVKDSNEGSRVKGAARALMALQSLSNLSECFPLRLFSPDDINTLQDDIRLTQNYIAKSGISGGGNGVLQKILNINPDDFSWQSLELSQQEIGELRQFLDLKPTTDLSKKLRDDGVDLDELKVLVQKRDTKDSEDTEDNHLLRYGINAWEKKLRETDGGKKIGRSTSEAMSNNLLHLVDPSKTKSGGESKSKAPKPPPDLQAIKEEIRDLRTKFSERPDVIAGFIGDLFDYRRVLKFEGQDSAVLERQFTPPHSVEEKGKFTEVTRNDPDELVDILIKAKKEIFATFPVLEKLGGVTKEAIWDDFLEKEVLGKQGWNELDLNKANSSAPKKASPDLLNLDKLKGLIQKKEAQQEQQTQQTGETERQASNPVAASLSSSRPGSSM